MKVGFDHQIFSIQQYGGISRYFVELANHLVGLDHEDLDLSIYCPLYKNAYFKELNKKVHLYGVKAPNIPRTRKILREVNSILVEPVARMVAAEVCHETYYTPKIIGPKKAKRVVTVYDMIHELFPEYFPKGDRTAEYKKIAIQRADHIICISENTRKDVINLVDVDPRKVSVIYLGHASSNLISENVTLPPKPYILYVGARDSYKNFNNLLKAFAANQKINSEYDLVAFGGGAASRNEQALIESLSLKGKVSWVSGDDALLNAYYQNASLFVYPSLYEGFGIPPLEAMSHGCVVACSSSSSLPEVVGECAEFFDPFSVESISVSLEFALNNGEFREAAVKKGFERVSMFSWSRCAEETYHVYKG